MFAGSKGRGGAGESRRSSRPVRRSTSDSMSDDEFARRRVVGDAAVEQLRGALQSRERIAQFVREALQRGGQRTRQHQRRIVAGKFLDRMRFEPPTAALARGQRDVREARRVRARERERHPAQSRALPALPRNGANEGVALELQRDQRHARQALGADPQPARTGRIGARDRARPRPVQATGVASRSKVGERRPHCTNVVRNRRRISSAMQRRLDLEVLAVAPHRRRGHQRALPEVARGEVARLQVAIDLHTVPLARVTAIAHVDRRGDASRRTARRRTRCRAPSMFAAAAWPMRSACTQCSTRARSSPSGNRATSPAA